MLGGWVTSRTALPLPSVGLCSLSPKPHQSFPDLCVASFTSVAREYIIAFLGLPLQSLEAWPLKPGDLPLRRAPPVGRHPQTEQGQNRLQTRFRPKREIGEMV